MNVAGVILAGGASARMGGHKPFMPFRGVALVDAAIARARPQVTTLAIDVPRDFAATYRDRYGASLTVLADLYEETGGPLCGVVTGLEWLDAGWLATFPCDTPFLPRDVVAQLARHAGETPVVAKGAQAFGLWPKGCLAELKAGFESGRFRSVTGAVEALGGKACEIPAPDAAFFNINTPEDLQAAEKLSPP